MKIAKTVLIISITVLLYSLSLALPPGVADVRVGKPGTPLIEDTQTLIDVNNLFMFVTNVGGFAEDFSLLFSRSDGLYFPAGTQQHCIFSAGLWIGAITLDSLGNPVDAADTLRLAIGAYDTPEYFPGPADADGNQLTDSPLFKVYKIRRDSSVWLAPVKGGMTTISGGPFLLLDSAEHFNNWTEWKTDPQVHAMGAPFDTLGNPLLIGDQTLWTVFNDGGPHNYASYGGGTAKLGAEVQATFFGFDLPGALGNTVFCKWVIINKSHLTWDSTYVSIWSDPDDGNASDDLVGCDTALSLGYCYNGTNTDQIYGARTPAVGFDFMQGPVVPSPGDTAFLNTGDTIPDHKILGMTSFDKYINGTDPDVPDQAYAYMKGLQGTLPGTPPWVDPFGVTTKFFGAGDPVTGKGWIDAIPADRRMLLSTGPFTMNRNDTQTVVAGLLVGQGKDRLSSITALKFFDQLAQFAFDRNFNIPSPPPRPIVTAEAFDRKVVLTWTDRSETDYVSPTHAFEGYNVYQGQTVAGPWTQIGSFDIKNGSGTLKDFVLDQNLGDVLFEPVVFGLDAGLSYSITITQDALLGGILHNGRDYYFAVTAYSYDFKDAADFVADPLRADSLFTIPKGLWFLENRQQTITVTPMDVLPGTDYNAAVAPVIYLQHDPAQAPTTDEIQPIIVDPNAVNGHIYTVIVRDIYPDTINGLLVWPDTVTALENGIPTPYFKYWELFDSTLGERVAAKQHNKSGNDFYPVIDGIEWKYIGKHFVNGLADVKYIPPANNTDTAAIGAGLGFFHDDAGYGANFFGSSFPTPDDLIARGHADSIPFFYKTVEVRFSHTNIQKAYRYVRPGYASNGFFDCNFQVWDVSTVPNRQLNAAFVENTGSSSFDSTWDPGTAANLGDREYLFILASDYSETPNPLYTSNSINANSDVFDVMYAWWPNFDGGYPQDGDKMVFLMANPAKNNDYWVIPTTAPERGVVNLAQAALKNIRVVPNPYYAFSIYEPDQFRRQVRFLGVPDEFTIRIFNVAGDKVRTLSSDTKPVGNSWMVWDLKTDQGSPVAGGVYIWYIEVPGVGTTFGKMAIFPEVEQLNTF